jgi:ribosomal protein L6P/L9E
VQKLRITCHFGKRKSMAVIRTTASHISNLITGVTKVRRAHYPPHLNVFNDEQLTCFSAL